jgi:hypothetical protein
MVVLPAWVVTAVWVPETVVVVVFCGVVGVPVHPLINTMPTRDKTAKITITFLLIIKPH